MAQTVILYDDGTPMANRKIEVSPMVGGCRLWPAQRNCQTGSHGELDLTGVVPGLTYHIRDTKAFDDQISPKEDKIAYC